jgi:hypothetical protein
VNALITSPISHPPIGKLRINYKMKALTTKISDAFGKLLSPKDWFGEKDNLGDSMKKLVEVIVPKIYPGMTYFNQNFYPGMTQFNPNSYPGMTQFNPNSPG